MKLDIQFFASAPIEATISKEYKRDENTKLVNEVKVIVTPTSNEAVTSEMLEGATVTLDGWTKCNDEQGSYYKTYTANKVETLTFKWTFSDGTYVFADVEVSVKEIGTFKYQKTEWINDETPVTAENMNNIEYGLEYISENGVGRGDSLPVGSIVEFDGDVIPDGYEEVSNVAVLFEDVSGTNGNFNLNDSAANYKKFEITYKCNTYGFKTDVIDYPNNRNVLLEYTCYANDVTKQDVGAIYAISGNLISLVHTHFHNFSTDGTSNLNLDGTNGLYITKVIGYKEV